jgi:hypothetical protein
MKGEAMAQERVVAFATPFIVEEYADEVYGAPDRERMANLRTSFCCDA